jgi:hypothetical protein
MQEGLSFGIAKQRFHFREAFCCMLTAMGSIRSIGSDIGENNENEHANVIRRALRVCPIRPWQDMMDLSEPSCLQS